MGGAQSRVFNLDKSRIYERLGLIEFGKLGSDSSHSDDITEGELTTLIFQWGHGAIDQKARQKQIIQVIVRLR